MSFLFKGDFDTICNAHFELKVNRPGLFSVILQLDGILPLFPKQVYLWGSILEKNRLDTLVGALGLVGRGFGPTGRAGLGWAWGLAVLGVLAGLGVGFGRAGRAGLGWAWGLAALGVLAGLGVGFGRAGRAGLGWAWGLAVLGALAGLGVGFGCAGRAALGWAWGWASAVTVFCSSNAINKQTTQNTERKGKERPIMNSKS